MNRYRREGYGRLRVKCRVMVYAADGSRHECMSPATHFVTLHGVDSDGVSVEGRFPPVPMCEPCALTVEPPTNGVSVLASPLAPTQEGK